MEIKQDSETGKLLVCLENHEKLNDFSCIVEDYVESLADVVSNNIGPEIVHLRKNQERLISIVRQQQLTIHSLVKAVSFLMDEEELNYRLDTQTKLNKQLVEEFNKLEQILKTK
jgi:hypothetical protein